MKKYLSLLLLCASAVGHAERIGLGDTAPNWMLSNMAGKQVSLYRDADQGRTTVMVFWSSWCQHCQQLLPRLSELQQRLEGAPVRIYALNIWEDGDPLAFMREHRLELELLPDADAVAKRYDIRSTPGLVVVGPQRKVLYLRRQGMDPATAITDIKALLPREGN